MPVPTSVDDLDPIPSGNSPDGAESVFPLLNDHIQAAYAFIAQVRDRVSERVQSDNLVSVGPGLGSELVGFIQSGAGAVARTVQGRLRDTTSVLDFIPVAQHAAIRAHTSTYDCAANIQAAIDAVAASGGGVLHVPRGTYTCSARLILKRGVTLAGDGCVAHPFYKNAAFTRTGTVLLIDAASGQDCISFETSTKGHFGIRDLSVFASGSAAIRSVCSVSGVLHPFLTNVELACLDTPRGAGLYISNAPATSPFTGQAITLYGVFSKVVVGNVQDGLVILNDCNANTFMGGSFSGYRYAMRISGTYSLPVANTFTGVAFESSAGVLPQDIEFVPGAANIHGWTKQANAYVIKFIKIEKARGTVFSGCYFENGSSPSTYDDGTNGSWPCASAVALDAAVSTDVDQTEFPGCAWNAYLLDRGLRTDAPGLPSLKSYCSVYPAALVHRNNVAQTVPTSTHTAINFGAAQVYDYTAIDYDEATKTATFKQRGTYLITATLGYSGFAGAADFNYLRAVVAGLSYYGPNRPKGTGTQDLGADVTCVVNALPGQTCVIEAFHSSGANQITSASPDRTYLSIVKM